VPDGYLHELPHTKGDGQVIHLFLCCVGTLRPPSYAGVQIAQNWPQVIIFDNRLNFGELLPVVIWRESNRRRYQYILRYYRHFV
jgi:hypothetical protein